MTDQELTDARDVLNQFESEMIAAEHKVQEITRIYVDQYLRVAQEDRVRALRVAVRDRLADRIAAERRGSAAEPTEVVR